MTIHRNKMKVLKGIFLFLYLIIGYGYGDTGLHFEYKKKKIVSLGEKGDLETQSLSENSRNYPTNESLIFEKNGVPVSWFEVDGIHCRGAIKRNTTVTSGLIFEHRTNGVVAAVTDNGTFETIGGFWDVKSGSAYMGKDAVFKKHSFAEDFKLEYVNIGSEGKIVTAGGNDVYSFYIKDHLGSTRMTIGKDDGGIAIKEVVQYQAYGSESDNSTLNSSEKTKEHFTGKELDSDGAVENVTDGIQLNYFGARYYDAEVGLWISTDPKEQFWGSYTYTGNQFNPINAVDSDGNWAHVIYSYFVAVATSPDLQNDMQWISHDLAIGDYAGLVGDVVALAVPGGTGFGRATSGLWDLAKQIAKSDVGDPISNKAYKILVDNGAQVHHIFTDKAIKTGFTKRFDFYLKGAGIDFQDAINLVPILGHKGRHGSKHWTPILKSLKKATKGLEEGTKEYKSAIGNALEEYGKDAVDKFTK